MELQVGVKAFITDGYGNYLMLKRVQPYEGESEQRWDIPGGRINVGEPIFDALAREIKEETGLTMQDEPRIVYAQDILRIEGRHVVRLTFEANAGGEVKLDPKEHSNYEWVSLEKMDNLYLDPYLEPVLKLMRA